MHHTPFSKTTQKQVPIDGSQLNAFHDSIDLEYILTTPYENNLISLSAYYPTKVAWYHVRGAMADCCKSYSIFISMLKDFPLLQLVRTVKAIEIDILMGCHCRYYSSYHTIVSYVSHAFKTDVQVLPYLRHFFCSYPIKM